MRIIRIVFISTILVILVCLVSLNIIKAKKKLVFTQPPSISSSLKDFNSFWKERERQVGGKSAYSEFKLAYAHEDATVQHLSAHSFGAILYRGEGMDAITLCDSTFEYGCYHGVFISAVSKRGLDVIPNLISKCSLENLWVSAACEHGVGHALVEHFGHTTDGLLNSLTSCQEYAKSNELNGCADGAFMEYQMGKLTNPGDISNPYESCESITVDFDKQVCYYSMPQWWLSVYRKGYPYIIDLCSGLKNTKDRYACFVGIGGDVAMRTNFNIATASNICKKIEDKDDSVGCVHGVYWATVGLMNQMKKEAAKICDGLSKIDEKICFYGK